jgi:hypothetical protein
MWPQLLVLALAQRAPAVVLAQHLPSCLCLWAWVQLQLLALAALPSPVLLSWACPWAWVLLVQLFALSVLVPAVLPVQRVPSWPCPWARALQLSWDPVGQQRTWHVVDMYSTAVKCIGLGWHAAVVTRRLAAAHISNF